MYEDLIKYGRMLFEQGLNNTHSGNMSVRSGDHIYITRHGARLGDLTVSDIVKVNLADDAKDEAASLEVKVHRAVYRSCPEVMAVAHAHCPHAIVLSLNEGRITPIDAEGAYYLPQIPVFSCANTICSDEVAAGLPVLIGKHRAAVVRGHGAFAGGKTLEEATMLLSVAESACRLIFLDKMWRR